MNGVFMANCDTVALNYNFFYLGGPFGCGMLFECLLTVVKDFFTFETYKKRSQKENSLLILYCWYALCGRWNLGNLMTGCKLFLPSKANTIA